MQTFLHMIGIQTVLLIYLLVGVLCRRIGIITPESQKNFIDFLLKVSLPCMVFNSFNLEMNSENMQMAAMALIISLAVCVLSYLLGKVLYRKYEFGIRSVMRYNTLISNANFVGLPILTSAYGSQATFFASIFIVPIRIFVWTVGVSLFRKDGSKFDARAILLNPGIVAVMLGFLKMIIGLQVPGIINMVIVGIGNCSTALSMIIIGAILSDVPVKTVITKEVIYISFIRLAALPLSTLVVLRMLNVPTLAITCSVVLVGMPVGVMSAMMAQNSDADAVFASKSIFVTTMLSFITVPFLVLLL